jgi:hypothetical protein
MVVQLKAKNVEWMALLSVVKLELNKEANKDGIYGQKEKRFDVEKLITTNTIQLKKQ